MDQADINRNQAEIIRRKRMIEKVESIIIKKDPDKAILELVNKINEIIDAIGDVDEIKETREKDKEEIKQ